MRGLAMPLLALLTCTIAATADRAADEAAWQAMRLKQVKPLRTTTDLVAEGRPAAVIVPAPGAPWTTAAVALQEAVQQATGVTLPLVDPTQVDDGTWAQSHLLVVGNLLNNPVYARLYHNFFVCADARYTGTAGYELRTVTDPWGTGRNAIALGAQAAAGLAAGQAKLLAVIAEAGRPGSLTLPWLRDLRLERAGRLEPVETLDDAGLKAEQAALDRYYDQPGTERGAAHRTIAAGMKAHRTGDPGWLEVYRYGLARHMEYYRTNEYIVSQGARRYDRDFRDSWSYGMVIAWDMLEELPGWTAAERLDITNHILRTVFECNLYQGWDDPERIASWRTFDSITHNHHTWPGLANLFGGWYFQRHYRLPVANDWLTIARGMFSSISRSAKPWEDAAGYQWIPMCHILTYALASGDRTYIDGGHAADSGRSALMMLNSTGETPGFGDHGGIGRDGRIPMLLQRLAYATGDGRFAWGVNWLGDDARGELQETYWADVEPVPADDLVGVAADYLPKLHYDLLGTQTGYFETPNLPFEQTFSKLTFRQSWSADAEYLMLDGYAGGSHGHLDANAICDYTAAGKHWLVDGEYIRRLPKYHASVTALRDGVGVTLPMNTRLDQAVWYGDGGLSQTTMPGYNGLTWRRNIAFLPGRYVAVIDELTAEQPGRYSLRCSWRVLGECVLESDGLKATQPGAGFTLRNLSGDAQELEWTRDLGGLPAYQLHQRRDVELAAGEAVRFLNLMAASDGKPPQLEAHAAGPERLAVRTATGWELIGLGGCDAAGYTTDAALYRLAGDAVWLAGATRAQAPGVTWQAAEATTVRLDPQGVATAEPGYLPRPGFRPAYHLGATQPGGKLVAAALPEALVAPQAVAASRPPDGLAAAAQVPPAWRFAEFAVTPKPLEPVGVTSSVEPVEKYRPIERLISAGYSSSAGSCMFPAGTPVDLTVDLGREQMVSELRIRAWEMQPKWVATGLRASLSNDGFVADERPVDGVFEVIGTERWGNNVNTIYRLKMAPAAARQVRFHAEPATPENTIYLAELELYGTKLDGVAKLVACAAVDLDGDGALETVIGTGGGEVVALSAAGARLWETKVDGAVTALAAGQLGDGPRVVYGTVNASLGVLGPDGRTVGRVEVPMYRGIPSRPRTILLADLAGDGRNAILAGAESWQYLCYEPDLRVRWKTVIYAHGATVGAVGDLDGDGRREVVAGNAYYRLQLLGSDGQDRGAFDRFGPEQTAAATGDLDGDGQDEIAMGTDDGQLLIFGGDGQRRWDRQLGDRLTSLFCRDGKVTAASESGYVWQLDGRGEVLWRTPLGAPVKRLVALPDGWLAVAAQTGAVRLDAAGQPVAVTAFEAAVTDGVAAGPGAVVTLADGTAAGVPRP